MCGCKSNPAGELSNHVEDSSEMKEKDECVCHELKGNCLEEESQRKMATEEILIRMGSTELTT